ncbi:BCDO2 [Lepeophtheirus salmonis]|uniref:BCDO2 n=1 Tax=Lepeophtheirus salmonis TaxID=72036 RepID=A0A7R8HAX3_LEPSM|nr:BCDO2 [Lepeophtheirus salmonis]CAF2965415.1 BCDO2 [Lepeophtheirus salmonis]
MLSVLQKFDISPSFVTYRNKIVDSKLRSLTQRSQAISSLSKHQQSKDPFKLKLQSLRDKFGNRTKHVNNTIADNCNDNICFFWDLETLSQCELEDYLPILMATPHPQIEDDGTIWNIGTSYSKEDKSFSYTIFYMREIEGSMNCNSRLDSAEIHCQIPCRHRCSPAFYHSFGLSDNYILFIEQPLFYEDPGRSRQYIYENSDYKYQNLKWRPHEGVRFYIVNKLSGRVLPIQYTAIPFFFFHLVNTYESKDGNLIVEVVAYDNAEVSRGLKFIKIYF